MKLYLFTARDLGLVPPGEKRVFMGSLVSATSVDDAWRKFLKDTLPNLTNSILRRYDVEEATLPILVALAESVGNLMVTDENF